MQSQPISASEWQVMQVIWNEHPATASDVVERLEGRAQWRPRTVKTLLGRLVRKGVLTFEKEGKRYLYRPSLPREQCVREASRSFLERVFEGAAAPALVHFAQEADLSPEEIETLQKILDSKKKAGKSR